MPSAFSVVAIIAAYNEADVIEQVVTDLVNQDIQVYFLDDGSTDATPALVERYVGRGVIAIERLSRPPEGNAQSFDWIAILARKARLSEELDADWFIHHDADEFRESPWSGVSLKEGIRRVDQLGYNAIDFACLNFPPVHGALQNGRDVRQAFQYYEPASLHDRLQIRCWKKRETPVDLVTSGGHEAVFPDRRVFPIRFILRHYPIRSQAHGERKVFTERQPRFRDDERARGWHVQYDSLVEGQNFIRDPSTLFAYDGEAVRLSLALRHRGVDELEESLSALRRQVDYLRATCTEKVAAAQRLLAETNAILANTRAALDEERKRVDDLDRFVADAKGALERQTDEIAALRGVASESSRHIDDLHRSWSWRATAAPRAIYKVLRGR